MEWIPISKTPIENGFYMCFVPDCKNYNKHWSEYEWNGKNFIDNHPLVGNGRIVDVTHYMIFEEPASQNRNKYIVIKELPDAHVGTEVIWNQSGNYYCYKKSAFVSPHDISYLTAGQVTQNPEYFKLYQD